VFVDGEAVAEIGAGLCVLLGVADEDGERDAIRLADKVAHLRIFENEHGSTSRFSTPAAMFSSSVSSP
jgi:D-tyrosyl-tRNA(Tyr) deacylase